MPHARRDAASQRITLTCWNFYSHTSYEAWLVRYPQVIAFFNFYPHASYEAWRVQQELLEDTANFYSHASYEAWRIWIPHWMPSMGFLLTRLIRGMTGIELDKLYEVAISTHTPHTRHDSKAGFTHWLILNFYSHASYEAWLYNGMYLTPFYTISTHTPHTRHDGCTAVLTKR